MNDKTKKVTTDDIQWLMANYDTLDQKQIKDFLLVLTEYVYENGERAGIKKAMDWHSEIYSKNLESKTL